MTVSTMITNSLSEPDFFELNVLLFKDWKMKRILLADDHSIVHEGLKSVLNDRKDFKIIDSAYSGDETISKIKKRKFDLVILDISMPGKSIFQVVDDIRSRNPDLPIIVYSIYPEEHYAIKLMEMGINGYLNKSSGLQEITNAIEKVLTGKLYISNNLSEFYANFIKTGNDKSKYENLTPREYDIFIMLASGSSVTKISEKYNLSKSTIANHRNHILRKLNLANNVQLTLYAINHDLLDSHTLFSDDSI